MPLSKIIAAVGVNLVVPFLGVLSFILLCRRMRTVRLQSPPYLAYFILFATYGGWLVVLLTALFWQWSGMASLGVFYLAFLAPIFTAALARSLWKRRALSVFHRTAFIFSIGYSSVMIPLTLLWICWPR